MEGRCGKVTRVRQVLLKSIVLDGTKPILGGSSNTCNEVVRGDMGLDILHSCRNRVNLKWWYKLANEP